MGQGSEGITNSQNIKSVNIQCLTHRQNNFKGHLRVYIFKSHKQTNCCDYIFLSVFVVVILLVFNIQNLD